MRATVGHIENLRPHPGADHMDVMDFVCPQYRTQIVTGRHYKNGERGLHIREGEIVPDELAEEMLLLGRLAGRRKSRVKNKKMCGVDSNGIFYDQSGRYYRDTWRDGDELEFSVGEDGAIKIIEID